MQQLAAFALLALTPLSLAPPTGRAPAHINCTSYMQNASQNIRLDTVHGQSWRLAVLLYHEITITGTGMGSYTRMFLTVCIDTGC